MGTVQCIEKNDRYKVSYYKHFVDQKNVVYFSMPKKQDIDVVPKTEVVNKIELIQTDNPNVFILFDDYFF